MHDGPGIRTTVFLKGCPLACIWCHNPESRHPLPQSIRKELKLDGKTHISEETVGREMSVAEVMSEIKKDTLFHEESGGGVTFSGGEVFVQEKFLISLLAECRKNDIHICIDTTGHTAPENIENALAYADMFLYDIKLMDSDAHREYCGVGNEKILANFETVYKSGKKLRLRFPVIPGITDTDENVLAVAEFAAGYPGVEADLLPYHRIGKDKYRRLGMEYHMEGVQQPTQQRMEEIEEIFTRKGITTHIGG